MRVEETADNILLRLLNDKVPQKDIYQEFPDSFDALELLRKDEFISNYFWPIVSKTKYYIIKSKGKAFIESGGYKSIKDYQRKTIDTAQKSMTLSLWAVAVSVISILVNLILWIASRNK